MDITSINENMGDADRVIRTLLAVTFVLAFFNHLITGAIGIGLLAVSVAFLPRPSSASALCIR